MNYKILFFDLDGTFLNSAHEVSQKNKQAFEKLSKSGIYAVPTSGRSDLSMQRIVKELNLKNIGSYMLCYNGGKLVKFQGEEEVIFSKQLSLPVAQKAFNLAKSIGLEPMAFNKTGVVACDIENKYVLFEKEISGLPVYKFDGDLNKLNVGINKILGSGDEAAVLKALDIIQREMGDEVDVYRSVPIFLEIVPKGVNKALGMQKLLKLLNIKPEQAVACGDGFNDLEMLEYAGLSLATGNAKDEIKQIASDVLPTNDEDGVAFAIEKYFGIKL